MLALRRLLHGLDARAGSAAPPQTAQAVCAGELSLAHAQVLAQEPRNLPDHLTAQAEPTLEAARRLDPPQLRRAVAPWATISTTRLPRHRRPIQHACRGNPHRLR